MRKGKINPTMCFVTWLCNWVSTLHTRTTATLKFQFVLYILDCIWKKCLENHFFLEYIIVLVIRTTSFRKFSFCNKIWADQEFFLIFQLLRSDVLRLSVLWVLAVPKSYPCHIKYTLSVLCPQICDVHKWLTLINGKWDPQTLESWEGLKSFPITSCQVVR